MPTETLFRDDAYLKECGARVVAADSGGIMLDRTMFYATGGGQPGDRGVLVRADGSELPVSVAQYDPSKMEILHVPAGAALPASDERVKARIDWSRWITDEELAANPGLVKTVAVKPPMGTGRVRLGWA